MAKNAKRRIMIQDENLDILAEFDATPTVARKILHQYRISGHLGAFGIDYAESKTFNVKLTKADMKRLGLVTAPIVTGATR